jgi:Mce-associated membrane protein
MPIKVASATEIADDDERAEKLGDSRAGGRRFVPRGLTDWRILVLALLVVASVAAAGGVYYYQYRPDQQMDTAAANNAKTAAEDGAVALLSYSPDHLDHDIAEARSRLTGDFLTYYTQFTEQIALRAARDKQIQSSAAVVRSAVQDIQPDSAVVLVFLNKQSWSKDNPQPVATKAAVRVTMSKVDHSWLIAKFEPI